MPTLTNNTRLIEPFIRNIIARVVADDTYWLDYVDTDSVALGYPSYPHPDFTRVLPSRMELGEEVDFYAYYPLCVVSPAVSKPNEKEQRGFTPEHAVNVECHLFGKDPDELTYQMMRYTRALTLLILNATPAQMAAGYPAGTHNSLTWWVTDNVYPPIAHHGRSKTYFYVSHISVTCEFSEG